MDIAQAGAFFDLKNLLTYQNVLVVIAAWFILETLKKLAPDFWRGKVGQKLIVLMPMVICQALVWVTVTWQPETSPGERIVLGLVLAFLTAHAHDVLKRFGLHKYVPVLGQKLKESSDG
jgi:hypothetical protein